MNQPQTVPIGPGKRDGAFWVAIAAIVVSLVGDLWGWNDANNKERALKAAMRADQTARLQSLESNHEKLVEFVLSRTIPPPDQPNPREQQRPEKRPQVYHDSWPLGRAPTRE